MNLILILIFTLLPFSIEKKVFGVWVTSTDILVLVAIAFWFFLAIRRKISLKNIHFPLLISISLLMATYAFSIWGAVDPILSTTKVIKMCMLYIFFYLIVNSISEKKYLVGLIYAITASVTILSVYFIIDTLRLSSYLMMDMLVRTRMWERHLFSALHLNLVGTILAVSIPLCLFGLFDKKTFWGKLIFICALLIQAGALALTYSRGNWIALAIILLVLFVARYRIRGAIVSAALAALPFVVMLVFFPKINLGSRIVSIIDSTEGSYLSRLEHIKVGYSLVKLKPIKGVGIGNFQIAAKKYLGAGVTEIVHNLFLQCAVDAGIFCAFIMLFLIIKYLIDSIKIFKGILNDHTLKDLALLSILGFGSLILSGQFGDIFTRYSKEYFALLLALPYAIKRINQNNKAVAAKS